MWYVPADGGEFVVGTLQDHVATIAGALQSSPTPPLIRITGPAHRAVDGLLAISQALEGPIRAAWWHIEADAPVPSSVKPGERALLLVHGLETALEDALPSLIHTVFEVAAQWAAQGWSALIWMPPDSSPSADEALREVDTRTALHVTLTEEQIPQDLDLEAKRRYAAQALLTLSYRPLHPLANERFLRAVEDFYVEPRVTTLDGSQDLVPWARSVPLAFLEGPPGSGKSIALAVIALDRARICNTNPVGAMLPVFANAGDLATAIESGDAVTPGALLSAHATVTWDDPDRMQAWLQTGSIALLVDGVDRLDDASHQRFWSWLQGLLADHPGVSVILSGRTAPPTLPRDWVKARLEPFSRTQIASYANRFFALIAPQYRQQHVANLLETISERPWLQDMASLPFHLLSLCLLVSRQGVLPRVRVRIVEFLVESLLSRWEIGGASDWTQRALREEIHDELSQLALAQRMSGANAFTEADVEAVVGRERADGGASDISAETLLRAPLEAGLVEKMPDNRYVFTHRAFLDYLAVEPIVGDIAHGVSRLAEHLEDRAWDDLIVLAAGMSVRRYSWKLPQLLNAVWPEDAEERQALGHERPHRIALALEILLEAEQDREAFTPWLVRASAALADHDARTPADDLAALEAVRDRAIARHGVPQDEPVQA